MSTSERGAAGDAVTDGSCAAVRFRTEGHIAIVSINRPEVRNAINEDVALGLEAAIDRLEGDDALWVGVLTAVPPVFCAGADLKEIRAGRRDRLRTERGGFAGIVARDRTKPLIAAVEGPALAGGAEICLACDLIVASADSRFGIPEVGRGLVAAAGGLFRLPRRIPVAIAMEMAVTGQPIEAERAGQLGLVNKVTAPGEALDQALAMARVIQTNAPVAVRASRRVVVGVEAATGQDEVGWRLSEHAMAEAMSSADMQEGLAAFVEKREPRWSGR
jgi:enoyl-CoA hydratase